MGAGILHNEKSPAVLSFYETPKLLDVSVTHCAYDGVTFVSAHDSFEMLHSRYRLTRIILKAILNKLNIDSVKFGYLV